MRSKCTTTQSSTRTNPSPRNAWSLSEPTHCSYTGRNKAKRSIARFSLIPALVRSQVPTSTQIHQGESQRLVKEIMKIADSKEATNFGEEKDHWRWKVNDDDRMISTQRKKLKRDAQPSARPLFPLLNNHFTNQQPRLHLPDTRHNAAYKSLFRRCTLYFDVPQASIDALRAWQGEFCRKIVGEYWLEMLVLYSKDALRNLEQDLEWFLG